MFFMLENSMDRAEKSEQHVIYVAHETDGSSTLSPTQSHAHFTGCG